jgi:hypothetical protein
MTLFGGYESQNTESVTDDGYLLDAADNSGDLETPSGSWPDPRCCDGLARWDVGGTSNDRIVMSGGSDDQAVPENETWL